MKDQVDELNRRGIPAAGIHSLLTAESRVAAWRVARAGELRLLYVAPERFASNRFAQLLPELPVSRFVVDEAHCVSEWGHEFRPDYRLLRDAAAQCHRSDRQPGRPPIAAFTATATAEVREDIVELLGLSKPESIVSGFDRPNIFLEVRSVSRPWEKYGLLPKLVSRRKSLVYTSTRRNAEEAAGVLCAAGVAASAYHAGVGEIERARVQDGFATNALQVVCATNAFGMGIDRPDIEVVVHADITGSVEAYYQEIGRAGRDGRPATATLLWDYSDVKTREFLIDKDPEERPGRTATTARSDGGCTTQGSRAPEAPSNDRLCRNQRVSARHDPAVFRRSTGTRAMRDLQQLCPADRRRRRTAPPRAQDSVRHRARR